LKCLLLLEDKTPPKDHNLLALFNLLDNGTKAKLEAEWVVAMDARKAEFDEMEKQFKIKIPRDLPTALAHCGNAFQIMRYIYENPTGANFFITDFPMALFIVIRRITGWK